MIPARCALPRSTTWPFAVVTALLASASVLAAETAVDDAKGTSVRADPGVQEALHLLDRWLDAEQDYEDIPSISAAVVHDQELVWSSAYGLANPETGLEATPQTIYSICSVSKLFTAVAVMTLYDEGKLRLDDELGDLLPWFDIRQTHEDSGPITLARVLSHSAGLPREADFPYWSAPEYAFPTSEAIREHLARQETLYASSDVFQYSNLGLSLAGEVVSEVSGDDYHAYVKSHILEPLGMSRTTSEIPLAERGKRMALGYGTPDRDGVRAKSSPFQTRGVAPAAGFASTVEDLARFASWQFRVLGGAHEVLKPSTLREMQRLHWDDDVTDATWGIGFSRWKNGETQMVGHGGYCPGYRTSFALDPKHEVAVIVAVSSLDANPQALANQAHLLVEPAITKAAKGDGEGEADSSVEASSEERAQVDLAAYAGVYTSPESGGERLVAPRDGQLVVLSLPAIYPVESIMKLRHEEGDIFRVLRENGDPADPVTFERNAAGEVTRMCRFQNCETKAPAG